VLVTGGSGLVGRGIQYALKESGKTQERSWIFLTSKEADLRKLEECKVVFEKYKPNYVIHLAAQVGGLFKNMRQKVEMCRDNLAINDNVLHCCKLYKVNKCISCLSTCIFPDKTTFPIDETMVHNGPPHPSNEGYAYAKRMIDVLNRCYNEEYGCHFTSIIPTNIFGPHDNWNLEDSHVIPGLIHKCYLSQKKKGDFVIWGSGKPLRQFIYSHDLGRLILWCLDNYDSSEPIITSVGEEDEVSIKQIAEMVAKAMNFQGNITFDLTKSDGQYKKTASNKKLMTLYPEFKFTPIDQALKETVEWFLQNYDTIRK